MVCKTKEDWFKDTYLDLCRDYLYTCADKPTTAPKDIPEAVVIMEKLCRFLDYVREFYNLEWDNNTFNFIETKRRLGFFEE